MDLSDTCIVALQVEPMKAYAKAVQKASNQKVISESVLKACNSVGTAMPAAKE